MLLTEEEAKKRWCPFSNVNIVYQSTGAGGNRFKAGSEAQASTRCLAGHCMAFRFVVNPNAGGGAPKGFCGLASVPHCGFSKDPRRDLIRAAALIVAEIQKAGGAQ